MKILFLSDIHGVPLTLGYDKILLLGDLLYHGPRNGVPDFYDPVRVAQMMFDFPMMSDYAVLEAGTETFFLTHRHLWNEFKLPPIGIGTVLVHGHTHIPELKTLVCGLKIFNPGSVSLPKEGTNRSFGYFDGSQLKHYVISGASDLP